MNLLDVCVLGVLAFFVLAGLYKGFLNTALSIGAYVLAWLLGMALMPLGARAVKDNAALYDMMLYYTEGSEYVTNIPDTGVELGNMSVEAVSNEQLEQILTQANVPYPMSRRIADNVVRESFFADGVSALGEYFNRTIVAVTINILVFLLLFLLLRLLLAFFINGLDYAWRLPVLRAGDAALGGALGVLRGMLALFLVFMLLPIALTVVGQFELVTGLVEESFFAPFFYRSNFLLSLIPGV